MKTHWRAIATAKVFLRNPLLGVQGVASCPCLGRSRKIILGAFSDFCVFTQPGSIASFERCRHVCFTPDSGRMTATQRTDALGQSRLNNFSKQRAYSITSSAMLSSPDERVRPSALAVFILITNSNLVGCWIGSSPTLDPLRVRSM